MSPRQIEAPVRVLVGSPLEPHLIERIRTVDPRVEVLYRPHLLGKPRFYADHTPLMERTEEQEAEWEQLLSVAEIMFDSYRPSSANLPLRAPNLRWIQFSSSGIAHLVEMMGLSDSRVTVTKAAGIHSTALAEYVLLAMLYFAKEIPRVTADQRRHHWERFASDTIRGKTAGIVGLGRVGMEVARVLRAIGVRVVGTKRSTEGVGPKDLGVDALYPNSDLLSILSQSDYLVLSVPLTKATEGLIGDVELGAMKPGAVLINISRGSVLDESALVRALQGGRLKGAALDVFAVEPLPQDSPLWDMPNVLISPHSMSTVAGENEMAVDLFCDNLRRYLEGKPLRNIFDREKGY